MILDLYLPNPSEWHEMIPNNCGLLYQITFKSFGPSNLLLNKFHPNLQKGNILFLLIKSLWVKKCNIFSHLLRIASQILLLVQVNELMKKLKNCMQNNHLGNAEPNIVSSAFIMMCLAWKRASFSQGAGKAEKSQSGWRSHAFFLSMCDFSRGLMLFISSCPRISKFSFFNWLLTSWNVSFPNSTLCDFSLYYTRKTLLLT